MQSPNGRLVSVFAIVLLQHVYVWFSHIIRDATQYLTALEREREWEKEKFSCYIVVAACLLFLICIYSIVTVLEFSIIFSLKQQTEPLLKKYFCQCSGIKNSQAQNYPANALDEV